MAQQKRITDASRTEQLACQENQVESRSPTADTSIFIIRVFKYCHMGVSQL